MFTRKCIFKNKNIGRRTIHVSCRESIFQRSNVSSCSSTVKSTQCYRDLQQEKEEVRTSLEETLRTLEEKHKEELAQLEERLGIPLG